jgi:hypothetical protein
MRLSRSTQVAFIGGIVLLVTASCGTLSASAVGILQSRFAYHSEILSNHAVKPIADLCDVRVINDYVTRTLNTPRAIALSCADERVIPSELVSTTWGDIGTPNQAYVSVNVQADSADGHSYFAYDHSLIGKPRYRGSPFYMSELPNIDGNAAIWIGSEADLETEFRGDEISITVYIPTNKRLEKSVAMSLATLILHKAFH